MKIQTKLIVAFLALSLPLLVITNILFYNNEKKTLSRSILNHLESVASIQQHRIDDIASQYSERLRLVASRTQLRLSLEQFLTSANEQHQLKMNTILRDAQASISDFKHIYVYSPDGVIVASSDPSRIGEKHIHEDFFVRGREGNIANLFYLDADKNLSLHQSGPLFLENKFLGVLLIDTKVDNMVTAISDYTGLGQTGETVLAAKDQNGDTVFIMPTRFDRQAALRIIIPRDDQQNPINIAFSGKGALLTNATDYRKVSVLAATRYIEDFDWGIVVKIDKEEAFAPLARMNTLLSSILTGAVCLIIFLSLYFAKIFTWPIVRLTEVAHNIAVDNFEKQAEESQKDEIGLLAAAFNKMTGKLINTRKILEKNINSLQAANQELRAGEERYREIYDAHSDAIFMHDADTGKILDVNQGMLNMYGYTYEEALQLDIGSISSGEHPYTIEEGGKKVQSTALHGPQTFEWMCRKKDGTLFWTEVGLKYTEFSGQRYVIAVVRDVNDRKQAEKSLAEEKEQLAVTLRSIGDGVITTDISGNIVLLNKVAEDLTGWSSKEATGRPLEEVFHIINEQTRKVCENPITKVISSGQIIGLANHTVLIAKDGRERSITDSGAPILDAKSNIIGVVLVFRDVTEKQRLEQEALKARKLESVGVLTGGIAHDFNNILAAILGNINLALDYTDPHESTYALLAEAEKASLRAKDLTQQLLTFAKGGEPVRKTTSIAEIITDSSSFVLRGSNVRCDTWFAPDLLPVDIDSGQISQVIQNIIINAAHAMPQGGVINIRCENISKHQQNLPSLRGDRYVVVTIEDHGIGIPSNIIDKIFDPYFSTKQTGSGLGLAICHSIITRHGGQITVESEPGKGTAFSIFLTASTNKIPVSPDKGTASASQRHGKIMIMDDNEMVRNMAKAMLSRLGYEIELAADGEEAIGIYKKTLATGSQADLIIMDLTIPGGMGGEDAVKEILAINPEAKILVSSGYSNDPIMANYTDYGFCGAIVKPYQLQEINTILQDVLG
jgi:PAS domain S-box-containing protein